MKITNAIYDLIMQHCPLVPPETGGIIGGHGELITAVIFDRKSGPCIARMCRILMTGLLNGTDNTLNFAAFFIAIPRISATYLA